MKKSSRSSFNLQHHGRTQSACRAGGVEPQSPTPTTQLVQRLGDHPRAGGGKGVTIGQGTAEHVELLHVHLTDGLIAAQLVTGKLFACKHLEVGQGLGSECLVHVDKSQIPKSDAGAVQRQRRSIGGPHQHVLPDVDGRKRETANKPKRLQAELLGPPFAHQQHGCSTVGERGGVGGSDRTVHSIKHRFELGIACQIRRLADVVVPLQRRLVGRYVGGKHLATELAVGPSLRGQSMGAMGQRILRLAADAVGLGHLLGSLPHGEASGIFGHCGGHRQQILDPQLTQNVEALLQIARLVEIHQGASQLLAHPDGQHGGGVCAAGNGDIGHARHDGLGDIGHCLETGGTGTGDAIGIRGHAHAGTEHDLASDVGGFRHLHHLAEHQLIDKLGIEIGTGEHLADHQFAEIHRRHAVIGSRLLGKRGSQTRHDGNPFALASRQFQWLFHPGSLG